VEAKGFKKVVLRGPHWPAHHTQRNAGYWSGDRNR
jgi:hypothetical protein